MKRFKTYKQILSGVLALSMSLSLSVTSFAAPPESPLPEIKYVSLGDSMTNGYGLAGYDGNVGVEDYGEESYANKFKAWLISEGYASSVDHAQLAMSAMRAEDLHWFLELDYTDPVAVAVSDMFPWDESIWNSTFTTGDYWTWHEITHDYRAEIAATYILAKQGNPDAIAALADNPNAHTSMSGEAGLVAEYYQSSVKDADIISLSIGNGNFGVFALGRLMEAIGFGEEDKEAAASKAMLYKLENAVRECDSAIQEKIFELEAAIYEKVSPLRVMFVDFTDTQWMALLNTVLYTSVSYALNYAGTIDAILNLNPDTEIILVALMNTLADSDGALDYANISSIGDVMSAIFEPLNIYIAALPLK